MRRKLDDNALVLATRNPGKIQEFTSILVQHNIKALLLSDTQFIEPEETGTSFVENASLKANAAAQAMERVALADDSGLVIPKLDGKPGVYSRRWAEECGGYLQAFSKIQSLLPFKSKTEAYFECALALCWPDGENAIFVGRVEGTLCFPARGEGGFGYDSIFQPKGYTKTFAEMDPSQKQKISHRAKALEQFIKACSP